ncbi:cyclopropane-fatty-acyl-phospholipid synthase family protein [Cognatiyoonia sp. IB215182]|uniref:cyclopropane-fatty-acyl-phospholipid synthase family protein n=1 Tax=Cognatiyoonia sp. IB215182 TaxID=3097353 RepID=UPI002A0CCC3B|nr:cyclopropane-fatty-acyl-phospholipid synthase family protein [Cognatiyoonia sp. IB215182]MDX8354959.1 cyclopropane-fatty-acyl-phospholipid synthase family protein [Cognatiyoonia sp. IB215182]
MWHSALDLMLRRLLQHGQLRLSLPDGVTRTYGDGHGAALHVQLKDNATVRHLVLRPDLAVGEAYMNGTLVIEEGSLQGLLGMIVANRDDAPQIWWQRALPRLRTAVRRFSQNNAALRARRNVAHHYDLSDALYDLFLDPDRQYSCGYFRDPTDTLAQAQINKKTHIACKLRLTPGMRVLDIGCGWGGMARTLARDYGAEVLGITLSEQQHAYAQAEATRAGLDDRVTYRLCDYRDVTGEFDRIVSVGMFEHVGLPHYRTYFDAIQDRLKPDGIALIHTIGWMARPDATNPWIAKYIFPGGYIPTLSEVASAIERSGLWVADLECLRLHYAETLQHWITQFEQNVDKVQALYDARFVRMWRFYLAACEVTFRYGRQLVFQFQLSRQIDAVPLTRDYLYQSGDMPT